MNRRLEHQLQQQFPYVYGGQDWPLSFEHGDGWFRLLHETSMKLNTLLMAHPSVVLRVDQVKEKWGSLNFYYHINNYISPDDDAVLSSIEKMIEEMCNQSRNICEICGGEGEIKCDGYWYFARCSDCFSKKRENSIDKSKGR